MIGLVNILLGIALLVAGRKLFWLFVAAAGFVLGTQLVVRSFHGPEWLGLVVGIVVGLLFAALAMFLKTIAIAVAGFLVGGSILLALARLFGIDPGGLAWLVYVVGGVIGIILVSVLFDWALISLSSLSGAALIIQELTAVNRMPTAIPASVIFFVLVIVGVVIQGGGLRRERK